LRESPGGKKKRTGIKSCRKPVGWVAERKTRGSKEKRIFAIAQGEGAGAEKERSNRDREELLVVAKKVEKEWGKKKMLHILDRGRHSRLGVFTGG